MAPLDQVIVGYREGDPRIGELWEVHGRRALPHKGCISCGAMTYFVESGQDALRTRDPHPICEPCRNDPVIWGQIHAEL